MINELTKQDISWYNSALIENKIINLDSIKYDIDKTIQFLFKESLKMHRRQMTPRVRELTSKQKIRDIRLYPFADERQYRLYIQDLMSVYANIAMPTVRQNIERWTEKVDADFDSLKMDDFNDEFQRMITELEQTQSDMFNPNGEGVQGKNNFFSRTTIFAALAGIGFSVSRFNKKQQDKFTKRILGQPFNPSELWLEDVLLLWSNNNFNLIKSLTGEYIKKVNTIVSEGISEGRTWDAIMRDMRGMNKNMTKSRATLIARDQVGKLNGQLTKRRSQEAGISLYRWFTALDERVRSTHKVVHNRIMRWDDNSVYADTIAEARDGKWKSRSSISGYVGTPGQDVQCRCTSGAVFVEMIEEVDKELKGEEAFKEIDKKKEERQIAEKEKKAAKRKKPIKKPEKLPVIKPGKEKKGTPIPKKKVPISREESEKRVSKNLKDTEDRIKDLKKENIAIIDNDGNTILEKEGLEKSVSLTKAEQNKVKNARVMTHNHPPELFDTGYLQTSNFTIDDIQAASLLNIDEVRATNFKFNKKTTFSMKGAGKLSSKEVKVFSDILDKEADTVLNRFIKKRQDANNFADATSKEIEDNWHNIYRRSSTTFNTKSDKKLIYRRVEE